MLVKCEAGPLDGAELEAVTTKDDEGRNFFKDERGSYYYQTVLTTDENVSIFRWDPPRRNS